MTNDEMSVVDGKVGGELIQKMEEDFADRNLNMATLSYVLGSIIGRLEDCTLMHQTMTAVVMLATDIHNQTYHADEEDAEGEQTIH